MVKLSVIIPVHNTEKYLAKCLESVINQTFSDMEIICINDNSIDKSVNILKKYAKQDSRIKFIQLNKNSGVSVARNIGIDLARGKYISFIDSDDWLNLDFYQKLMDAAELNNADIAMAGTNWMLNNALYKAGANSGCFIKFNSKLKYLSHGAVWDKIYKLSVIKDNNLKFPQGRVFEDNLFVIHALWYSNKLIMIDNTFYNYFQNQDGICRKLDNKAEMKRKKDKLFIAKKIIEFGNKKKIGCADSFALKNFIYKSIFPDVSSRNKKYIKEIHEIFRNFFWIYIKLQKFIKKCWLFFTKKV